MLGIDGVRNTCVKYSITEKRKVGFNYVISYFCANRAFASEILENVVVRKQYIHVLEKEPLCRGSDLLVMN